MNLTLLSPIAAAALAALGLLSFFAPRLAGKAFGLPEGGAFLTATGARDLALGCALFGLWWQEDVRAQAILTLSLAVVATADAVVVYRRGTKSVVAVHVLGLLGSLLYGAWLFSR